MAQACGTTPSPAAALLQLARLKAGLSQRELAERASVPTTMISAYERDKRQPTLSTLLKMVRASGFDLQMRLEPSEAGEEGVEPLDAGQAEEWRRATSAVPPSETREASSEFRRNPEPAAPANSGA